MDYDGPYHLEQHSVFMFLELWTLGIWENKILGPYWERLNHPRNGYRVTKTPKNGVSVSPLKKAAFLFLCAVLDPRKGVWFIVSETHSGSDRTLPGTALRNSHVRGASVAISALGSGRWRWDSCPKGRKPLSPQFGGYG